jgi:hypothetical protein
MMLNSDTDSEYTESAYGASSDSSFSEEKRKSCEREHKKPKKAMAREKKKKEKVKAKKNTCPHCKKYHRKKPHRVEPDKCMWTKKYKGYRFKLICDELEVDFKPRIKFSADLGRYAEKDDSGSE